MSSDARSMLAPNARSMHKADAQRIQPSIATADATYVTDAPNLPRSAQVEIFFQRNASRASRSKPS